MNVSYNTNFIYVPEGIYKPELEGHYLKSKRAYRLPNNPYAWQQLYQTYRQEAYKLMYQKKMQGLYKIKAFKKQKDIKGDKRLRPYQRVDVEYIRMVKNAGVFNEMRTGEYL